MDFEKVLFQRRSIRNYEDREVDKSSVDKMIKAAKSAPSANDRQPWHFVVIRSDETMEKIMKLHPHSYMLEDAQLAISVCGDRKKGDPYWVQDCSAATQNLLLMAENLGLGAVWLGVYPRRERIEGITDLLNLPDHIVPLNVISIGYPAEESRRVDRFEAEKVHYEEW